MKKKASRIYQLVGISLVVLGCVGIGFSMHFREQIRQAAGQTKRGVTALFFQAPVIGGALKEQAQGEISHYYSQTRLLLFASIAVSGVGLLLFITGISHRQK